ncbi:MAG: 4Fe-4S dicluster domain-containing protein [Chloroflexi bacterium]|nr:4Fe-4S dicluster domain-containing protein [Chloroflexota bacterium]MDA1173410.1 4Fe-4S dicluster domain-containing protein [Chloroflexota bacterium]
MATQTKPQSATDRSTAFKWSMVIDLDRCTGCEACVVACQSENNVPINEESAFIEGRAFEWIRLERYWEGEWPDIKARFIPVLCQHCENAPCEPVCPVYATYHNNEGLNVQVYNRCVGTRYCGANCPYHARQFNFWEPVWPEDLRHQLNPDVTVRTRGVMEKCSMCIQRIRRATRSKTPSDIPDGAFNPACVQACPTSAMTFGNLNNPESKVSKLQNDERRYHMFEHLGTAPTTLYLKQVDTHGA